MTYYKKRNKYNKRSEQYKQIFRELKDKQLSCPLFGEAIF